jgi:tetratricopeptide (TPR) repeat protein
MYSALFWTIVLGVAAILFAILFRFWPGRTKLTKSTEEVIVHLKDKIDTIEKAAKEANENIKLIEKHFGIPIYVDGLPSAPPPVFDPFAEGLKLMKEYKWDEAITEFKQAMKEAKASQLVALYSLIGYCYDIPGKSDLAVENYSKSLTLAREFKDKEGETSALNNLSLMFKARVELDKALRYSEDALKIAREIDDKEGEARALVNLGSILTIMADRDRPLEYLEHALKIAREIGDKEVEAMALGNLGFFYGLFDIIIKGGLDRALEYFKDALKIYREMGSKVGEAQTLKGLGLVYQSKGEKRKSSGYFENALKIFTQLGSWKWVEITKEDIIRLTS